MQNVQEMAIKYAEGKGLSAIDKLVADAYAAGYQEGYKAREAEIPIDLRVHNTKYIDLNLPSGTLWSDSYETDLNGSTIYLTYDEAAKLNIPTFEQFEEFYNKCEFEPVRKYYYPQSPNCWVLGPNGVKLFLERKGCQKAVEVVGSQEADFLIWFRNCEQGNCMEIEYDSHFPPKWKFTPIKLFTGYRLPVRLVKQK